MQPRSSFRNVRSKTLSRIQPSFKKHNKLSACLMILDGGAGKTPGHKVPDGLLKNRINLFICRIITASECKKSTQRLHRRSNEGQFQDGG